MQDLPREWVPNCLSLGELHVAWHASPKFFIKWCNLVRFGVYFDKILPSRIAKCMTSYAKISVNSSHVFASLVLGHEYTGFAKYD